MRTVLSTFGFADDIGPLLAVATELRSSGHQAIVALSPDHQAETIKAGVEYFALGPSPCIPTGHGHSAKQKLLFRENADSILPTIGPKLVELCENADVLIGSPWDPICRMVQESIPATYVSLHLCPFVELNGDWRDPATALINDYRSKQGLPSLTHPFEWSIKLALYAVSSSVFSRPAHWGEQQKLSGFLRWEDDQWQPESALVEFCATERPIVAVVNEFEPSGAQNVSASLEEALRQARCKMIFTRPWRQSPELDDVYFAPSVLHSWLFARADLIIHPGDVACTANALRSGVPAVVIPHTGVQRSWAEVARAKGCARYVIPLSHVNGTRLAGAIRGALAAGRSEAAAAVARQIETENSARTARLFIEDLVTSRLPAGKSVSNGSVHREIPARSQTPILEPVNREAEMPLSFAQQRLWLIDQFESGGISYNMTFGVRFGGDLNKAALHQSVNAMVRRHEILRTVFPAVHGRPVQKIWDELCMPMEEVSLEHIPEPEYDRELQDMLQREMELSFDLAQGPLLRMKLLRLGPQDHVLVGSMHHIVSDGWSIGIMLKEISLFYKTYCAGQEPALPKLKIQYADYAVWQRAWLQGEVLAQQLEYWRNQLAGIPALELPTDHPRPAVMSYGGERVRWILPAQVVSQLRRFSQQRGLTPFMVLLAAVQITLSKYTGQEDVSIGTPIANRNRKDLEDLIGCFINTLVLRTDLSGNPTFDDLAQRIRAMTADAYRYQDLPFERLVQELQPERDLTRTPFFQVMLVLQNLDNGHLDLPGLRLKYLSVPERVKFDLMLDLIEWHDGRFGGDVSWASELYEKATILRFIRHLEVVIEKIIVEPQQKFGDLCLLTSLERQQLLSAWNETGKAFSWQTAQQLFEEQVARTPDAIAVAHEGEELTYTELNRQSNHVSALLKDAGVGPGEIVGLMSRRNINFVVGMIAIWKTGAAYLPMDGCHPAARWRQLIEQSGAGWVLAEEQFLEAIRTTAVAIVDRPSPSILNMTDGLRQRCRGENFVCWPGSTKDLAYVIYTSGSTGTPKGAMIEQGGLVNHLHAMIADLQLGPGDRMAQTASQNFDISVWQFVALLLIGGRTEIISDDAMHDPSALWGIIRDKEITVVELVPSLLVSLAREAEKEKENLNGKSNKLRWFLVTGEAVTPQACRDWITACPRIPLLNAYGPAECSDDVTLHNVQAEELISERVPIGRPISNLRVYILDRYLVPVPVGVVGELHIGGIGVGRGYLGDAMRTADAFIPDAWSGSIGGRIYRTGDLGRYRSDGVIEYLGRADHQVKVRGYRIELGEIESVLSECHGVRAAVVVVAGETGELDKRLVAYVVRDENEGRIRTNVKELKNELKTRLPDYMVPTLIVELQHLPLTENGKVDRKALPAVTIERSGEYVRPRTSIQKLMSSLWAGLLKVERVGLQDNFFDLGGHSLLGTQLMSRIREVFKVSLPLRCLFEHPTMEGVARLVEESRGGSDIVGGRIPRLSRQARKRLSFAQQRLWFLHQFDPGSAAYNVAAAIRMIGKLDPDSLRRSLNELLRRHEVLRARFVMGADGEPEQEVIEGSEIDLPLLEVEGKSDAEKWVVAAALSDEEAQRPFDLSAGPVIRGKLLRLGPDSHVALLTMHHIVSDGWSVGVLMEEMTELYRAYGQQQDPKLEELPIQYSDFAAWQREWLQGDMLKMQLSYWQKQLEGISGVVQVPADHPRPAVQTFRGDHLGANLDRELTRKLQELARRENVTLYMLLMAAFHTLLWRYTGQEDIAVGTPVANRVSQETERLIGFFVNTLVIRMRASGADTFLNFLAKTREVVLDAYTHQDIPFEKLVEELKPERDPSRSPLVQVLFALQNVPVVPLQLTDLELALLPGNLLAAKFDLSLKLEEVEDKICGTWEYSTDLFGRQTITRIASHWQELLRGIIVAPQMRLSDLSFLGTAERNQIVHDWNRTKVEYAAQSIVEIFEAQVRQNPNLPAVRYEEQYLTYGQLNSRVNKLAHYLRNMGVRPEAGVGLFLDRSIEIVVGLLAVLKAGGAYVPLDTSYPKHRLTYMLEDAKASVVITTATLLDGIPGGPLTVVCMDRDWDEINRRDSENPAAEISRDSLAYVIFTSGSTGRPKGVGVTHAGLSNYVQTLIRQLEVRPGWSWAWVSTVAADLGNTMLFPSLCCGGVLHVIGNELARDGTQFAEYSEREGLDCLKITPTHLQSLLMNGEAAQLVPRQRLVLGGEASAWDWVQSLRQNREDCRIWNHYGPTEATIGVAMYEIPEGSLLKKSGIVPIGKPLDNTRLYVLGEDMEILGVGIPGELYIGGSGLARGYLGQPDTTAERFVPNPFGREGERLYWTGDRARWLADGEIEYLGRIDAQVKLRGYRVELGEIETILAGQEGIQQATVMVREEAGQKRLVAYIVCQGGTHFQEEILRDRLRDKLPEYMVPSAYVCLKELPLTANGKLDRKALPEVGITSAQNDAEPRTVEEEILCGIWSELLHREKVGIEENFFDLGGHSLLATQVVARVREVFQIELPLQNMFDQPTIAGLGKIIRQMCGAGGGKARPAISPRRREGRVPLSYAQQRLWFISQFTPSDVSYNVPRGVRILGHLEEDVLYQTLAEIVRRHEILRTRFPLDDGGPHQVADVKAGMPLRLDLSGTEDKMVEARRLAEQEAQIPFDLVAGPLLRMKLLRLEDEDHVLLITMHHIISDAWSAGILVQEISQLYAAFRQGEPSSMPELPIQYADFSVWQRAWLKGEILERELTYWHKQLANVSALDLPTDRPHRSAWSSRGETISFRLDQEIANPLKKLGRAQGATLFMTLLAAFQVLLSRYSGQEDIAVGSPIAGRTYGETEKLIGCFLNMLVLRTPVRGAESWRKLLATTRRTALEAYAHQEVPFEKLVEELQPARNLNHTPLFQVMFILQNAPKSVLELGEAELQPFYVHNRTAAFDLTFSINEDDGDLCGMMEYRADLFHQRTIAAMAVHYQVLLRGILEQPGRAIAELPLLTHEEQQQILREWNDTACERPAQCVHELFAEQAKRAPDACAIVYEDQKITYAQLDRQANQLAQYLQKSNVGSGDLVGICIERCPEMVAALLGILRTGAAYLPLDPSYPVERMSYILADAAVKTLITQEKFASRLGGIATRLVCLEHERAAILAEPVSPPDRRSEIEAVAYTIYTSGSTGKPKGVQVTHRNLANLLDAMQRRLDFTSRDRLLAVTTISFDIAGLEIYLPLVHGAQIVLASRETIVDGQRLLALIAGREASVMQATPATWRMLIDSGWDGSLSLKILCGGDTLPQDLADQLIKRGEVWNMYGPTETTIWSAAEPVQPGSVMLGGPIQNTQLYLLDPCGQPVPIGVPGELYIGGEGVALGYLNRPTTTAEKFLPDPFSPVPGSRLYKTGDVMRYVPGGKLEFLGRKDHQVKIRGFRVELAEIESVLATHPAVEQACVLERRGVSEENYLAAYVAFKRGIKNAPTTEQLKEHLRNQLPEYMVPAAIAHLERMPLTANGKLDRNALPEAGFDTTREYVAPRSATEEALVRLWEELLRLPRIGIHDNFFEMGGHSLLATRIVSRVAKDFRINVPLLEFFSKPTIVGLADSIKSNEPKPGAAEKIAKILNKVSRLSSDQIKAVLEEKKVAVLSAADF